MKKIMAFLLILTLIITAMPLAIADEKVRTSGDFEYTIKGNGTATIVGYNGDSNEDIIIPNMLDGYVVTTIGKEAFALDKHGNIRSATLPESITSIDEKAFWCSGVTSINIPTSVTHIGYGAFSANDNQIVFRISNSHPTYAVIDGALYDKKKKELFYLCPNRNEDSPISIPEGIVSIGDYACYHNKCVDLHITFPSSLKSIGNYAFASDPKVKNSSICIFPTNETLFLESIGDYAFWNAELELKIGATTIGNSAFENAFLKSWDSVNGGLMEGTEIIGASAFKDSFLNYLDIPASVKEVGAYSFQDVGATIHFLKNSQVTTIGEGAFYSTSSSYYGKNQVFLPEESQIRSIGAYAFYGAVIHKMGTTLNNVETIGEYAFYHRYDECNFFNPQEWVISANCKTIPTNAFNYRGDYTISKDIYKLQDGVETIESQAFAKVKDFYLPESLTDIAIDAFAKDSTFVVELGSYAERWAEENAYPYSINGQEQNLDWLLN